MPRWFIGGIISLIIVFILLGIYTISGHLDLNDPLFKPLLVISMPVIFITIWLGNLLTGSYEGIGGFSILIFIAYYFCLGVISTKILDLFRE